MRTCLDGVNVKSYQMDWEIIFKLSYKESLYCNHYTLKLEWVIVEGDALVLQGSNVSEQSNFIVREAAEQFILKKRSDKRRTAAPLEV